MSEQVPVDPFIHFMERFRVIMAGRLREIGPHDLILEFVDKVIWHALQDNKQDYSYIVLQSVFRSMGISQEQKHRFIQHAGWANFMQSQRQNVILPATKSLQPIRPIQPIHYNHTWNARQEGFTTPARFKDSMRSCTIQQQNVQQKDLGSLGNTAPQLDDGLLETDGSRSPVPDPFTIYSSPVELSFSMETRSPDKLECTSDWVIEQDFNWATLVTELSTYPFQKGLAHMSCSEINEQ